MMLPMTKGLAEAAAATASSSSSTMNSAAAIACSSIKRVVSCFILTGGHCRDTVKIAIFHRVATMPTFPNHFAACSGSIEAGETPWQTACREVMEETNLTCCTTTSSLLVERQYGLYVDVPYTSKNSNRSSIIRVYPFTARLLNDNPSLELKGTEHDRYQWVSVQELEALGPTAVPALSRAFHHATFGHYLQQQQQQQDNHGNDSNSPDDEPGDDSTPSLFVISPAMRAWASDKVNGATNMVANVIDLLLQIRDQSSSSTSSATSNPEIIAKAAQLLKMLRPSMVPITNVLTLIETQQLSLEHAMESLKLETERVVNHAVQEILPLIQQKCRLAVNVKAKTPPDDNEDDKQPHHPPTVVVNFCIATFSRSSTILAILKRLLHEKHQEVGIEVICGRSTPGNEGEVMAQDVAAFCGSSSSGGDCKVTCLDDDELEQRLSMKRDIDLFLTGSDCVMLLSDQVVNKVGTMRMAAAAKQQRRRRRRDRDDSRGEHGECLVYCCADRFKLWQDFFPPPLEDIFECIPITPYFDRILITPPLSTGS